MPVQSVIFERKWWDRRRAEQWLKQHRFAGPPESIVDATDTHLRYRQLEPAPGARYFTKALVNFPGVKLVIELGEARGGKGRRGLRTEEREAPPDGNDIFCVARETSDQELDAWGRNNIGGFLGVVARSDLCQLYPEDEPMPPGTSCILNLDYGDYLRGGTHWTAMRVSSEAPQVLYIDPFGAPPPRDVTLRAALDSRTVLYPDIINQMADEVNCGPRALAVLHQLAEGGAKGKELETFGQISQV